MFRTGVVQPDVVDPAAYVSFIVHGIFHVYCAIYFNFCFYSNRYSSPGYSITPYSSYIPTDVSSYSSYPSVEPYSAYHDLHSDISPYDHSDHHIHDSHHYQSGHEHYSHDFGNDHDLHDHSYALPSPSLLPNTDNANIDMQSGQSPVDNKAETTQAYRRVSRHRKRRQANRPQIE